MAEQSVSDNLAQLPETTDRGATAELTVEARAILLAERARVSYPDQYVLREDMVKLARLVAELAAKVERATR